MMVYIILNTQDSFTQNKESHFIKLLIKKLLFLLRPKINYWKSSINNRNFNIKKFKEWLVVDFIIALKSFRNYKQIPIYNLFIYQNDLKFLSILMHASSNNFSNASVVASLSLFSKLISYCNLPCTSSIILNIFPCVSSLTFFSTSN